MEKHLSCTFGLNITEAFSHFSILVQTQSRGWQLIKIVMYLNSSAKWYLDGGWGGAKSYLLALVVVFFSLRPVVVKPCTAKESRRVTDAPPSGQFKLNEKNNYNRFVCFSEAQRRLKAAHCKYFSFHSLHVGWVSGEKHKDCTAGLHKP